MYRLQEVSDGEYWNDFVVHNFGFYSFLSSWEWWELNQSLGHEVWRLAVLDTTDTCVWLIQCIKHSAKRWTYLLCPHCPLIVGDYFSILWSLKSSLMQFARAHWAWFMRINGVTVNTFAVLDNYKRLGLVFAPIHAHAEETNLLDLHASEDDILSRMRKTTRYLILRAVKEWVVVERDNTVKSVETFIWLHLAHAARTDGKLQYTPFSPDFIRGLFALFPSDAISCFNAYYGGVLEASLVCIIFGKKAVYYLWVSDIKHPKFSPAYLCQWEAIKYAKAHGCDSYNFWWVCPDDNPKHPLYGPSLFKRWFGWKDLYLTHAHDLVCSWKYYFTYVLETLRKRKRGYYYLKPDK